MSTTQARPHLASRVRRLADEIASTTGTRSRNRRLAEQLAGLAALLWTLDEMPFRRAAEWADTGLVSGGGGDGSGASSASTPVEREALAGYRDDDQPDPAEVSLPLPKRLAAYDRWLRFYRRHLEDLVGPMAKILDDIGRRSGVELDHPGMTKIVDPVTGKENRVAVCAEYWCEDGAVRPRRGRCEACDRWVERWLERNPGCSLSEVPVVPRGVIEDRRIRRKRKAVA